MRLKLRNPPPSSRSEAFFDLTKIFGVFQRADSASLKPIWAQFEVEMRGPHMGAIMSAIQSLAIIDARKGYRLGLKSMLHILEAQAMQL